MDANRRRVSNAVEVDQVFARREDQDAARERIGDKQILAVVSHRGGRANAPRAFRLGELHEVRLADHQVSRHAVRHGDLVVDQDAIIAGIGHEQTLIDRQREAREVQRRLAAAWIPHFVGVDLVPPRRQRDRQRHVGRGGLILTATAVVV